jgi:hypothetical protein
MPFEKHSLELGGQRAATLVVGCQSLVVSRLEQLQRYKGIRLRQGTSPGQAEAQSFEKCKIKKEQPLRA